MNGPGPIKKAPARSAQVLFLWAQLGLNQRPPDYESGATNQLSYGPEKDCKNSKIPQNLSIYCSLYLEKSSNFDFNLNTARELEFHQSVYCFWSRAVDVEKTAERVKLKLFA